MQSVTLTPGDAPVLLASVPQRLLLLRVVHLAELSTSSQEGNMMCFFFVFRAQNLGGELDSLRLLNAPLPGDRLEDPRDLVSLAPLMTLRYLISVFLFPSSGFLH